MSYNSNIQIPTKKERGDYMNVGVSNHMLDRLNQRFRGKNLIDIFEDCWVYNPLYDNLPKNLTNQCIMGLRGKTEKYQHNHLFYVNDTHNCIIVLGDKNKNAWKDTKDIKPNYWCDWSILTIWECNNGIWINEEIKEKKELVKIGNKYYYL
jgi:hypothetical protein